ncbi:LysE family translocator [Paenibacillus melissococcoides]|uniref:LysE family translocator n=1 Tax=Paenibacillus melissococcoides TaxID=2912268 RepID=A0ABN8U6I7_9BACL|nr:MULTISPECIES: LysE family translocator [Paenibacillus]MEB9897808.1 LysE family translocator [Bacillus cereus]CAH8246667.1 LysE family translocator [Paenibacillus melissococcoides]CAH8715390.1 LysE family translocator [Paenibacillus melissococcoides]CAH8716353.1 LysE family translocator [Paenibacillus melissococcoides]GIO80042.1 LysE family translocator [Paenibacillus dendritiformis]
MDVLAVLSFLGVAVLLTLMPGPDNVFVLAQSLSQGKKAGIATALGLCTGLIVHVAAATFGISAIIYQSALAFAVVKYAGAVYLLYLAWKSFREKGSVLTWNEETAVNYYALYKKGILMNLLNPKVSLFFLALLPQFVDQAAGHVPVQMLVLGVVFILQAIILFSVISFFAEKLRSLLAKSPSISRKMNYIQGTLLGLIAAQIAFSEK